MIVAAACAMLLVLTTLVHYEGLRLMAAVLQYLPGPPRSKLIVVVLGALLTHALEILLYGLAIYGLVRGLDVGSLGQTTDPSLNMALYFSAETYTSLGYGDVVPQGSLRMLAGVEALNGLLLIGWSGSFLFVTMERFWGGPAKPPSAP